MKTEDLSVEYGASVEGQPPLDPADPIVEVGDLH